MFEPLRLGCILSPHSDYTFLQAEEHLSFVMQLFLPALTRMTLQALLALQTCRSLQNLLYIVFMTFSEV